MQPTCICRCESQVREYEKLSQSSCNLHTEASPNTGDKKIQAPKQHIMVPQATPCPNLARPKTQITPNPELNPSAEMHCTSCRHRFLTVTVVIGMYVRYGCRRLYITLSYAVLFAIDATMHHIIFHIACQVQVHNHVVTSSCHTES